MVLGRSTIVLGRLTIALGRYTMVLGMSTMVSVRSTMVLGRSTMVLGRSTMVLTLVGMGCNNYVKAWGGGRSALLLKNSKIRLETIFFKVCHCLHYIKIIIVMVGLAKEKLLKKKLRRRNPRGGKICPPQAN